MQGYLFATLTAAACLTLAGCNTLDGLASNPNCTTRISGEVAFGSITPTGKAKYSSVCKAASTAPALTEVAIPAPPEDVAAPK